MTAELSPGDRPNLAMKGSTCTGQLAQYIVFALFESAKKLREEFRHLDLLEVTTKLTLIAS